MDEPGLAGRAGAGASLRPAGVWEVYGEQAIVSEVWMSRGLPDGPEQVHRRLCRKYG